MTYNYTFHGRSYNFKKPIPEAYEFEKLFDADVVEKWIKRNWHYSLYISIVYLVLVFALQRNMKSRAPFNVTFWMSLWNSLFALFSTCCSFRGITFLMACIRDVSFLTMSCDTTLIRHVPPIIFWGWLFLLSKVLELGDTLFIVLSKKKLLFLHCYHHAATLVLAWYLTVREIVAFVLMGYVNTIVHSFMYSYFTFKCLGFKIPRVIAMFITVLQILQMIFGLLVSVAVYWTMKNAEQCDSSPDALHFPFCIYASYAILFCHLFHTSYIKPIHLRKKKI